uniref:Glutamine--fructose-6-phosphate aminotransferase [isomerizing] n=1 Tax=viral metagenome TaxID=1070528 RepID=A0A6C0DQE5_9ZZZZ
MCGIVGYLGNSSVKEFILTGLRLLQNRGYDSVGIGFIFENKLTTIKYASTETNDSLKTLETNLNDTNFDSQMVAIGHTRWATHGGKTDLNAHPHHDNNDRISIVHNGIIENFKELKKQLICDGYFFRSQTDTEIISVLIGKHLDNDNTMEDAIRLAIGELSGTWALVIIHRDYPNKIWVTRNGSPLLLGMDDTFIMIASEQIAFSNYIQKYISIENHDIIEITKTDDSIVYNKSLHSYSVKQKQDVNIETTPTGYDHWMLKEIFEQPESIQRALNNGGRIESNITVKLGGLDQCRQRLLELNHIILLGCGTSFHAGLWSLELFKKLDIFDTVSIYDGADFSDYDIPKKGKTGLILLSQSGETRDLHRCLQIANDYSLITIGVVNVQDSLIARETDCGVYLNAGREVAVASTKSFTNQCIILTLISIWFSQNRGTAMVMRQKIIKDIRKLFFNIQSIFDNIELLDPLIDILSARPSMFLLGKGQAEAIAKEGALKLKEIAYINAEGYSASALKHGPFAMITDGLPIFLFDINEQHREKIYNTYQEIAARGAYAITITDNPTNSFDGHIISIEKNQTFGGILANIYIQIISYLVSIKKGNNPDYPRNLAKVVTVE